MKKYTRSITLAVSILLIAGFNVSAQVTDTGNEVGIGNATPTYKLDVNGDINLTAGNVIRIGGNQVFSTEGLKNMFLGDGTGTNLTTGAYNAAIGFKAGEQLTTGQFNTLIGFKAGQNMTTANSNTIIGKDAGKSNTGNQNVLIGREAGIGNHGAENTFIGDKAGLSNVGGFSNTLIGKSADVGGDSLINATAIGANSVVNASNSLILGNGANVGIGTSAPGYDLDVAGDINFTGTLYENGVAFSGGSTGPTGAAGAAGAIGATGPQGATGSDASAVFAITDSVISNENGTYATDDFVFGSPQLNGDGNTDHHARMFFDKSKAAFRAGRVDGVEWDSDSLGIGSVAMGYGTKASGDFSMASGVNSHATEYGSIAMGENARATGSRAVAIGDGPEATGVSSTAMGEDTEATGDYSTAMGSLTEAVGNHSTAMGFETDAIGVNSIAMGWFSKAIGNYSNAIGYDCDAIGVTSTAMGNNTEATGDYSTAMGSFTDAESGYETTFGRYDTDYIPNSATTWDTADRLFVIGNGTSFVAKSDALVILKNGNTGIGISIPGYDLDVAGDINFTGTLYQNGVALSGGGAGFGTTSGVTSNENGTYASDDFVFGSPQLNDDGNTDHDYRMFFDKSKGAFRAGEATGTHWDVANLGTRSVALGYNTEATGDYSTAIGNSTDATGHFSTAMGYFTVATGSRSTAMGNQTEATGDFSTAMGSSTTASGSSSTAMGGATNATGHFSTAMGNNTEATGDYSTAMGYYTDATGSYSTSIGRNTNAESGYETAIGRYNTNYTPNSTTDWDAADRLFVIGNGTGPVATSDAMVILKNGNIGIGTSTPNELLEVEGDVRIRGNLKVYGNSGNDDDYIYFDAAILGTEHLKWDEGDSRFHFSDDLKVGGDLITTASSGVINIGGSLDPTGNVIGDVASPNQTVATGDDDLWIEDDLEVKGSAYKTGGGSWATISDKRLKTNIRKYEDGLEELITIEPKWFQYNDKWPGLADGRNFVGVMAQDMLEIAPYMVEEKPFGRKERELENGGVEVLEEGTDYYTYDPSALTYMLVNAVKEQQEMIEEKDERIVNVEDENEGLRNEVSGLKKGMTNNEQRLQNAELRNEQMAERLARMEELLSRFDTDLQQCCTNWTEEETSTPLSPQVLEANGSQLAAKLEQNAPNPFRENSTIKYYLPSSTQTAQLIISTPSGVVLKTFTLQGKGFGQVLISGGSFAAGTYLYTLNVDGKKIATKKMMLL